MQKTCSPCLEVGAFWVGLERLPNRPAGRAHDRKACSDHGLFGVERPAAHQGSCILIGDLDLLGGGRGQGPHGLLGDGLLGVGVDGLRFVQGSSAGRFGFGLWVSETEASSRLLIHTCSAYFVHSTQPQLKRFVSGAWLQNNINPPPIC